MRSIPDFHYCMMLIATITLLMSSALVSKTQYPLSFSQDNLNGPNLVFSGRLAYNSHSPIGIISNTDFSSYGFPGNGTAVNPYIIENYSIVSTSTCISISDTDAHFIIQNCLLTGGSGEGIIMSNVINGLIRNNTVTQKEIAVYLTSSSGNVLTNNTVSGNIFAGFHLDKSPNNVLEKNTISNTTYYGVYLFKSPNNTFSSNTMINDTVTIVGVGVSNWHQNITSDNLVNGKILGYFWNETEIDIDGAQYGQVILANCTSMNVENGGFTNILSGVTLAYSSDCTLRNNTISGTTMVGVEIYYALNNFLVNNTISEHEYGLFFTSSRNNDLVNNTITYCTEGMWIDGASNNHLISNVILGSVEYGFAFIGANSNTLTNNTVSGNRLGIYLLGSNNELANNTISGNRDGVSIRPMSNNNKVVNNSISGNTNGLYCAANTLENMIYLNNFSDNSGLDAQDDGAGNFWNITGIGNYWGNYSGIGVYHVPGSAGSIDYYPNIYVDAISPIIDHPDDMEYVEGTLGHSITWNPIEANPSRYVIYQNNSVVETGYWDGGEITISIDGLNLGSYNYTIKVFDLFNNWVSDDVVVTVFVEGPSTTPPATTTTTSTSTTTTEFTTDHEEPYRMIVFAVGVGAGIVILGFLLYRRFRP